MKTLLINAHPNYYNMNTYSAKLQNLFKHEIATHFPDTEITTLNIYETVIPKLDNQQLLNIWEKQNNHQKLDTIESQLFNIWTELITQFKEHHRIVIVMPMHNFNIPSKLKDYMDNILIARETFKYTSDGSVGLMTDNYKGLLLQASGSVYTNNDRYTKLEFSYDYLKAMFEEIMGFDSFDIVRAEGTAIYSDNEVMTNAQREMFNKLPAFYK
ncbi:FMN-dependent NADH-azoreductase [Staphylococcus gallinarum]|uniref:FMN-dependent NADH-azoreductase n=1 Tax=Staphylococcus gallinarum TaxID=1293 RepID=UPI001E356DE3|nr:NAD(P)H-dependent oxidoreductase [Staphylococcus gallinarum]MCD8899338.1 NAD(P)H-dependent oxidoreductase [Staphylococcus gallinarum]MCD8902504.1 NAD(P)H-dependent oxidoreductase [Staphylococcus gallinarum]MCD8908568.1 NAD(P)H-dependent oxidoreductase [Staphylococcus gallinarum]MEB6236291.1 NAD(P)H-dependent oxidoreductase [Staphylococcus gallinarum]MEB7038507.1 NAD(P)H-dependent oxidoreductase [Staphylococcus gallinarum]